MPQKRIPKRILKQARRNKEQAEIEANIRNYLEGVPLSEEARQKLDESLKDFLKPDTDES